jgi:hypothetical protein
MAAAPERGSEDADTQEPHGPLKRSADSHARSFFKKKNAHENLGADFMDTEWTKPDVDLVSSVTSVFQVSSYRIPVAPSLLNLMHFVLHMCNCVPAPL